jgi:hypothetical protein
MPAVGDCRGRLEFVFYTQNVCRGDGRYLLHVRVREADAGDRLDLLSLPDCLPCVHGVLKDVVWGRRELAIRHLHLLDQMQLGFLGPGMYLGPSPAEECILPLSDAVKLVCPCMPITFGFPDFEQGVEFPKGLCEVSRVFVVKEHLCQRAPP